MDHKYGWTKAGVVKVLEDNGASLKVQLPGRKTTQTINKTHILPMPTHVVLTKKTPFDQDCGCTAFLDIFGNTQRTYNVYGSVKKYLEARKINEPDLSAHYRRKYLAEYGFLKARGSERKIDNRKEVIYKYQEEGYKIISKQTKMADKVVEALVVTESPEVDTKAQETTLA